MQTLIEATSRNMTTFGVQIQQRKRSMVPAVHMWAAGATACQLSIDLKSGITTRPKVRAAVVGSIVVVFVRRVVKMQSGAVWVVGARVRGQGEHVGWPNVVAVVCAHRFLAFLLALCLSFFKRLRSTILASWAALGSSLSYASRAASFANNFASSFSPLLSRICEG